MRCGGYCGSEQLGSRAGGGASQAAPRKTAAAWPADAGSNAVFPSAVDPKYPKESAGKARMHTCVDQYNANKAGMAMAA